MVEMFLWVHEDCEYKRSKLFFDLWPRTLIVWQFQTSSQSHWANRNKISCRASLGWGNRTFSNSPGHMTSMASMTAHGSILFYPITLGGRRGTTDEFATIPFHLDLFSAALVELAKSIPVHSLILSSHLFFCLLLFLFSFTVPCWIVFAKPEDLETWPNHLSFRFVTWVDPDTH